MDGISDGVAPQKSFPSQSGWTTSKDVGYRDAELKIACGLQTDFLSLKEGLPIQGATELPHDIGVGLKDKVMASQLPQKPLYPDRPQPTQNARQLERRNAIDSKHVHRLGVVAEHQRPAFDGAPPQALFAKRNLPILKVHTDIGIKQSNSIDGRKRRSGRNSGNVIDRTDELPRTIRLRQT